SHSSLIFNETKVLHARLQFAKATGGKVEIFCLEPDQRYPAPLQAMQETREVFWKCMVGGAAKWKADQILILMLPLQLDQTLQLEARLIKKQDQEFLIKFNWHIQGESNEHKEEI